MWSHHIYIYNIYIYICSTWVELEKWIWVYWLLIRPGGYVYVVPIRDECIHANGREPILTMTAYIILVRF